MVFSGVRVALVFKPIMSVHATDESGRAFLTVRIIWFSYEAQLFSADAVTNRSLAVIVLRSCHMNVEMALFVFTTATFRWF